MADEFLRDSLLRLKAELAAAKAARKASTSWSKDLVEAETRAKARVRAAEKLLEHSGNLT